MGHPERGVTEGRNQVPRDCGTNGKGATRPQASGSALCELMVVEHPNPLNMLVPRAMGKVIDGSGTSACLTCGGANVAPGI